MRRFGKTAAVSLMVWTLGISSIPGTRTCAQGMETTAGSGIAAEEESLPAEEGAAEENLSAGEGAEDENLSAEKNTADAEAGGADIVEENIPAADGGMVPDIVDEADAITENGENEDASSLIEEGVLPESGRIPEDSADAELPDDAEPQVTEETAEINDPLGVPDEIVPVQAASGSGRRRYAPQARKGTVPFSTQLNTEAKKMYDGKVRFYASEHHGAETWTYIPDEGTYTFEGRLIQSVSDDGKTSYTYDKSDETTLANLKACRERMMADMQAAADAFKYDHPEVFWIRSPKQYKYYVSGVRTSSGADDGFGPEEAGQTAAFCIQKISYTPVESFTGAGNLISAYEAGVSDAASEVKRIADSLNTEHAEQGSEAYQALLVRAVDRYLSGRLSYDSRTLNVAVQNTQEENRTDGKPVVCNDAYRIYTSAAAFLPENDHLTHGAVCEGYAKAFKVLCDRIGIGAVCIAGKSDRNRSGSGHMWNLVQIGGVWYLTDPTWDDIGDTSSGKYLLVSDYTNNTDLSARMADGNLSGNRIGIRFVYPEGSAFCYRTSHREGNIFETKPDGGVVGHHSGICAVCGEKVEYDIPAAVQPGEKTEQAEAAKTSAAEMLTESGKTQTDPERAGTGTKKETSSGSVKRLKKTNLKKVKAASKGRFRVTFARAGTCTRYQIQYATRKDFSNAKTRKAGGKKKTNTVTIRAKRRRTYYVRVRAVSGKRTGAWSRTRKVKTR